MQHRLFKLLLENEDIQSTDILLHTEVSMLSKGKILERFIVLLPQIKKFIASRGKFYEQLENKNWLINFGFLTDITAKLNEFSLKMQGKNQHNKQNKVIKNLLFLFNAYLYLLTICKICTLGDFHI